MSDNKQLSFSITIDGVSNEGSELAKLEFQLANLKKEKQELMKVAREEGMLSNENKLKIAAYNKEIGEQTSKQKELKKVVDSASDSLNRKRALLIQLKEQYANAGEAAAKKMIPTISKLNEEISKSEQAIGVHQRNVGNYPQLTTAAAGGFGQLSSAVGGATGEIGGAISTFATAGGAAGVFTALLSTLAMAWKRVKENVDLYLGSADKLKFGYAGYEKDTDKARKDALRRASGQIATGQMSLTEANRVIDFAGSSAEQREQAELMKEQAKAMIEEGKAFRDQVFGIKDKINWTLKYNKLLQDAETIADEKLAKEIEWEELEANLIKQRAIVSDQESTLIQKKQAAIDADSIATQLVGDKTAFINKQMDNINAIAEMTFTQEVVEDEINGLLKERNTIQKEYYADQVKINRLQKATATGVAGGSTMTEGDMNALIKAGQDIYDKEFKMSKDNLPVELKAAQFIEDEKQRIWDEGMQKARENHAANKQLAQEQARDMIEIDLEKMEQKREIFFLESQLAIGAVQGLSQIFNKSKGLAIAAMMVERAQAIPQIIANVALANSKMLAKSPATFGQPWVAINTGMGALAIAGLIAESVRGAKEINKYESGGKINKGFFVNTGGKDDTLIMANKTETVLTQDHVRRLGGSGVMKRIGVPGYAEGGYLGSQSPDIPSMGFDYSKLAEAMKQNLKVILNVNELNSAQNELNIINETLRI